MKIQIQHKTPKRLFYNKWPIKVECIINGSNKIARAGVKQTLDWCNGLTEDKWTYGMYRNVDKVELGIFCRKVIGTLEGKDLQIRSEHTRFNIFCKDVDLLSAIKKEFSPWIVSITAPKNKLEYEFLLNNGHKKVLCDDFPHKQYRYKVIIAQNTNSVSKEKFLAWSKRFPEKIRIANSTELWLMHQKYYLQDPFFYVADEKTLSMVCLYLGNSCRKIQEFILKSSINT